jgi:anti-sigma factor RsiW
MSCERMEGRLVSYMDGRATERDRRTIESHLKECSACRARVKGFQGVWSMLNELPVHEPSAAFEARLRALLAAEPVRRSFWESLMPAPRMAFAVAMLAIFSFWISSRQPVISGSATSSEAEFRMIQDLPLLENYDVLVSFDVLSQLPAQPAQAQEKN